jgi:hypothetical protein
MAKESSAAQRNQLRWRRAFASRQRDSAARTEGEAVRSAVPAGVRHFLQ